MFDHLNPYFSQDKSSSLNPLSFPDKPSDGQFEKNPHQSKFSWSEPYLKYIFCSKTAIFNWLTPHFPGFPGQSPVVPGGTRAQRDVLRRGIALRRGQLGEAAADNVHQGVAQDVEAHHGEMLMHIVEIYYV